MPPKLVLDNEVICGSRYFVANNMVSCEITSDPKSIVELSGSALANVQEVICEEADVGWKCSATATYVGSGNVVCKASLFNKEACACGQCDQDIQMSEPGTFCLHDNDTVFIKICVFGYSQIKL